ncbi:unnamed protein product [Camellia sinensis]
MKHIYKKKKINSTYKISIKFKYYLQNLGISKSNWKFHEQVHIYSYIHYSIISEDGSGSAVGNAIAGPEVGKCLVWREEIDTGLFGRKGTMWWS